jgi:flagellar basal-body rod protein FlgF
MDTTGYIALSRQLALQRKMAVIAQNVANVGTTGYRAEHALFEPVPERAGERPRRLDFVQDVGLFRDLAPGALNLTGNPLDVAVKGEGYLAFQTPAGERYGRAGRLELDAAGRLVDPAGNPVLDEAGAPITLPPGERRPAIAEDGTVSGGGGPVARIQLVAFADEQALRREGDGLYRAEAVPRPATGRLVQGALEGSNVAAVTEMTAMIATARAFEGVQRLIEAQHETAMRAIDRMISVKG